MMGYRIFEEIGVMRGRWVMNDDRRGKGIVWSSITAAGSCTLTVGLTIDDDKWCQPSSIYVIRCYKIS